MRLSDIERRMENDLYEDDPEEHIKEAEKQNYLYPFMFMGKRNLRAEIHNEYFILNEFSFLINETKSVNLMDSIPYEIEARSPKKKEHVKIRSNNKTNKKEYKKKNFRMKKKTDDGTRTHKKQKFGDL